MCPKKVANAHEARRDLKERANPRRSEASGNRGFAKANAHEAQRCLKERANRRRSEASGNSLLAVRPCGVPEGDSRKRADSTIHTLANAAAVPAKDNPFRVSRGRSAYGVPLGKGDLGGLKRFLWTVHNLTKEREDNHHATS